MYFGNIKKDSLQDILTESKYEKIVSTTIGEKLEKNKECASCPYIFKCKTGCPALSILHGDDFTIYGTQRAKCIFFKEGFYDRLMKLSTMKNEDFIDF